MIAADSSYPLLNVTWTIFIVFAWVIWFWLLISVFSDVFRRHDISGWAKALWVVFVIVLPYLGVLIYLISQSTGMSERGQAQAEAQYAAYGQSPNGGSADQIVKAKKLLDDGAINQDEYDALKKKALAA